VAELVRSNIGVDGIGFKPPIPSNTIASDSFSACRSKLFTKSNRTLDTLSRRQ
jgi:hypothetical protein